MKIAACPCKGFIIWGTADLRSSQVLYVEGAHQKVLDLPSTVVSALPTENDIACICQSGTYLLKIGFPQSFSKFPKSKQSNQMPVCVVEHEGRPVCADICDDVLAVIEENNGQRMFRVYDLKSCESKNMSEDRCIASMVSLPVHSLCSVLSSWLTATEPPLWLLGSSDGNLFVRGLSGCLRLVNVVEKEPIKDIFLCPTSAESPETYDGILIVGKQGKISLLSSKSGKVAQLSGSTPTPVKSCCLQGSNLIYTDGDYTWRISLKDFQTKGCNPVKLPFCGIAALVATRKKEWASELALLSEHGMIYYTKPDYESQSGESLPMSDCDPFTMTLNPSEVLKQMQIFPARLQAVNKDKEIHEEFIEQLSLCVTGDSKHLKKQISVTAKVLRMELFEQEQVIVEVTNNSGFSFRHPFWRFRISLWSKELPGINRVLPLGNLKTGTHYKTSVLLPKGPLPEELRVSLALLLCPPSQYLSQAMVSEEFGFKVLFVLNLDDVLLDQLHFLSPPTVIVEESTRLNVSTNESMAGSSLSLEQQVLQLAKTKPGYERTLVESRKMKTVVSVLKSMLDIGSKELLMLLLVDCEQRGVEIGLQEGIKASLNECQVEIFARETDSLIIIQIEGENGRLVSGVKGALIRRLKKLNLMTPTDTATLPEAVTKKIEELWSVLEHGTLNDDELYKLHGILRSNITAALPIF